MEKDIKLVLTYLKGFLASKKLLIICIGFFLIFGLIDVFSSDSIYESKTTFISQSGKGNSGGAGLKNIAALIGVNVGGSQGFKDIPMYLYPKLISSIVYNKALLEEEVNIRTDNNQKITIRDYILEKNQRTVIQTIKAYTIGLPRKIIGFFKKKSTALKPLELNNLEYLSSEDRRLIGYLESHVVLFMDSGDNSLEITATSDNPVVAAQLAQKSKEILQQLIIDYRIAKLKENYEFVNSQYEIKKEEYETARNALAYYTDRNRFNNTPTSLLRKNELEKASALAYSLFAELESQRISAQITLEEVTPIFTTINPSVIALEPSNPSAIITLIKYLAMGLLMAIFVFGFKMVRNHIRSIWREI